MKRFIWTGLTAMLTITGVTHAADFYVNGAANVGGDGSQASPFTTVQAAINAAGSGDTIRVAAGTYRQNLRIEGKAVVLEGGYSAAFVRNIAANTTTLQGEGNNAVINLLAADATVDGFRITGGTGSTEDEPFGYNGAGIYSKDGSPVISNNLIEGNDLGGTREGFLEFLGGGIYVYNAPTVTIRGNVIRNNKAGRGGGMSVTNCDAANILENTVENNEGRGDHGGGMFIAVRNAVIRQNVVRGNEIGKVATYGWGGGLIFFGEGNTAEISFNTFINNYAEAYGAGEFIDEGATAFIHHDLVLDNRSNATCEAVSAIAVDGGSEGGSDVRIEHVTVVGNMCATVIRGNGLQVEGNSTATVKNSIFWNNGGDDFSRDDTSTLTVTFTDSQEPFAGTGNISADPLFVNEAGKDFRLAAGSPCINAADPTSPFSNEPNPNGGRADMGRFGNAGEAPPVSNGNTNSGGNTNTNSGGNGNTNSGGGGGGGAAGLCPSAAALMLSMSLIGVRRVRRASSARC